MRLVPFEYCALQFLIQWKQEQGNFHAKMKGNPSPDDIRESLRHFRVARNFKGLNSDKKANFIAASLRRIAGNDKLTMEKKVSSLASKLKNEFHTFNLSAVSKLLWLTHKSPFVIYDSRVVKALQKLKCPFNDTRDYTEFCKHWRSRYDQRHIEIQKASARLIDIRGWLPVRFESENELKILLSNRWLRERVFDKYLWELGGNT